MIRNSMVSKVKRLTVACLPETKVTQMVKTRKCNMAFFLYKEYYVINNLNAFNFTPTYL
jgi:hypothetical protein